MLALLDIKDSVGMDSGLSMILMFKRLVLFVGINVSVCNCPLH